MKLSQGYWQTYKETPNDAEVISHQLMARAGMIFKSAGGIYNYLPMAQRSIRKIENIIREELDKIGCFEIHMSVITPADLWMETGRWEVMGPQMLRIKDRAERDLCVSPTNEETVTDIFRKTISSYKQLPLTLYQINTKFRDEIRPRFGLLRGREFTMKDAYSFHLNKECLDKVYENIYQAYVNIFNRMGLDFISVEADGGAMAGGGAKTHEFQVIADNGEDIIVTVPELKYAANIEKALTFRDKLDFLPKKELQEISTPNQSTCEEVCRAHGFKIFHSLKSIALTSITGSKEENLLVLVLGDDNLNEIKLSNYLKCDHLRVSQNTELEKNNLIKGFMGPYKSHKNLRIIFDSSIDLNSSYVIGANKIDTHLTGFVPSRDCLKYEQVDIRLSKEGDVIDNFKVVIKKGIEVGHVFQLGDKYTKSMKATVLNSQGQPVTPLMGCYGIGVTRTLASAIEQNNDKDGMIWPAAIAPYDVYLGAIAKDPEFKNFVSTIYQEFITNGIEVLFDDRYMGPGPMFKDADLLGLPLRIIVGERDYQQSKDIEIKVRKSGEVFKVKKEELLTFVKKKLKELGK
jgi:prolyl-tRNA synthetase